MHEKRVTPSLNALRAFAVAGRRLNLAAAAAELHVTPSALSHQIRGLEATLGVALFNRTGRGLELTAAGEQLLPGLTEGFERIHAALAELAEKPARLHAGLTVSMLSTFAMRWFIPRLAGFQQRHPEIEIRIATSVELAELKAGEADCAIRFGDGNWPGLACTQLFAERLVPVCSPELATEDKPLRTPADLARHTLLHARLRPDDWRLWLHAAGIDSIDAAKGQSFETRNFAIQAAIDGLGVAVVDPHLVAEELKRGSLITPFPEVSEQRGAYWLVYPEDRAQDADIRAFAGWLLQQASENVG